LRLWTPSGDLGKDRKPLITVLIKIYRWWRDLKRRIWNPWTRWPPLGAVDLGDLRRLTPISRECGWDRGLPVDRYYIEGFLQQNQADIHGRVLEIGDPRYTQQFGGDRVTKSDVLHVNLLKPGVTIIGDLTGADEISSDRYDCLIITQTLQLIYEVRAAIKTSYRILKPGGVVLATFPGISQIARARYPEQWKDYWRFTSTAAQRLFAEVFPEENLEVQAHGNVLAATAFLQGLGINELAQEELDHHDPDYEVLIGVRAVKP
jgi:hypothetical protein